MVGYPELLVILLIVFLIFGGKKLPELGAGLGKAIRSFNRGLKGTEEDKPDDAKRITSTDAPKEPKA